MGEDSEPGTALDYDEVWAHVYGDMQQEGPVHRHLARMVARILASLDYATVLDVGCGPGHNHALLSHGRQLSRFSGVDVSAQALERARERVAGDFMQADIQVAHPDGSWDLVYCSLVLEHLRDDTAALQNMHAVTGKYLLVTTIGGNFERYRAWDERMGHVRNYATGELEHKLANSGFRVLRSTHWGFPFYSPLVRRLQNLGGVGTGEFSRGTNVLAKLLYGLYYLNSSRRGDIVIILASPRNGAV